MNLVSFNEQYRRAWMFQRNKRKIYPWQISQMLSMIHMQLENDTWSGNQDIQNQFTKNLEKFKLKKTGEQYDSKSGGARTYFSQLESLGLLFTKKDKSTWLTIAGEDLIEAKHAPAEIMRTQLLNYQYPSIYSKNQNVKIHPDIKVKPFIFVLELLLDSEINYLTDLELIIPVTYGHNFKCFDLCKQKILTFRETGNLLSVIDNPDKDLYTIKTKGRSAENGLKDFKDIANTCKNFLESVSLVISEKVKGSRNKRIIVNDGVLPEIIKAIANKNKFITVDNKVSFQRKYGAWNRTKDTRRLVRLSDDEKISRGEPIIHALFAEYAGKNLVLDIPEDFVEEAMNHGFDKKLILKTIEPYMINTLSLFEQKFMELSVGGAKKATEFEKAVKKLFEERLHYKATHTGQRYRRGKTGGFSDIFVQELSGRFCAIIDTKASPKYNISSQDYHTMTHSYIPSINEINEYENEDFAFCAYVAGGFKDSMNNRVNELSLESGHNFAAIKAYDLLKLCQKKPLAKKQEKITDIFKTKKLLTVSDFAII
jgi:hypothetical protein